MQNFLMWVGLVFIVLFLWVIVGFILEKIKERVNRKLYFDNELVWSKKQFDSIWYFFKSTKKCMNLIGLEHTIALLEDIHDILIGEEDKEEEKARKA